MYICRRVFSKRYVSAAYLTGEGFDVEKLPERFAKLMVTRRKAFVGQNLLQRVHALRQWRY